MSKHHNILAARTSFFNANAGKIENLKEFK